MHCGVTQVILVANSQDLIVFYSPQYLVEKNKNIKISVAIFNSLGLLMPYGVTDLIPGAWITNAKKLLTKSF